MIKFEDFLKIEMRIGKILEVSPFKEALKPAYLLTIDFGESLGIKKSSAQITNYHLEELVGKLVVCVTNLAPKQIGPIMSEVLVLGVSTKEHSGINLLEVSELSPLGARVH